MSKFVIHSKACGRIVVTISTEDFERVLSNKNRWNVSKMGRRNKTYIYVYTRFGEKKIGLHRFIMNPPDGMVVDHIDGNTLNNLRTNLRICTHSQNLKNAAVRSTNRTGFKGVSSTPNPNGKYRAWFNGEYIGCFSTPKLAHEAWVRIARVQHGEFFRDQ